MYDLIKSTEDDHFEEYRISRLTASGRSDDDPAAFAKKNLSAKMKQDEESLRKKFTEQVKLEEARFRKWEQNVSFVDLTIVDCRARSSQQGS